jgi:hypothetical protein
MASITTRAAKGSPLTNSEVDANFTNLNAGKMEVTSFTAANIASTLGDTPVAVATSVNANGVGIDSGAGVVELNNVQDFFKHAWSSGVTNGCALTDNGNGTVSIAAGEICIRVSTSDNANLTPLVVPAQANITCAVNDVSYLYVNYNAGSPVWQVAATLGDFNGMDKVIGYVVGRNGLALNIVDLRNINVDFGRKNRRQKVESDGFIFNGWYRSSLAKSPISSSGLNIQVGAGRYYYFDNPHEHSSFDTSVAGTATANVFKNFYNRTGSWTQQADQKTINVTQYDLAGTLTTLGNGKYRTDYVYAVMGLTNDYLAVVMGNVEHANLAAAQAATAPSALPPQIDGIAILVGQVCLAKSAATLTVTSVTALSVGAGAAATVHNNLTSIQGGIAGEYYHLSSADVARLANTSGTNTGDQTSITGNAGTATTLQTARNINGVAFNGSANITINAVDSTARIASSEKGAANGVATLDASALIPAIQLPSYVDDVLEYANLAAFPVTGETGKIYVALDTNKTYRWSGTVYIYITSGAVDSVAGKTGVVTLVKADVGLSNVDNTSDATKNAAVATLTNKTLTTPTLTLKNSAAPTPTVEGDIQWDTDGDFIVVGNGASQSIVPTISSTHTFTNKTWNGVVIGATYGGTGLASYAIGDLLYAPTTTTVGKLADVAAGNALISGGVGVAPSYGKIGLTTHISGTLPVANGGTGLASYAIGDLVYASGATAIAKLADVDTGNALISGGVGAAPSYGKIGLTTHVSGTLPQANGGTGGATQIAALQALGVLCAQTVAKSAAYTVVAADRGDVLLCTGTFTLTLTAAATLANGFSFGVVNVGTGVITIDPNLAELIDGAATLALAAGKSCLIVCDATGFRTVGLSGGAINDAFYENAQTISANYTITTGKNAMTAGPITINNGVTVTVPNGSVWSVI